MARNILAEAQVEHHASQPLALEGTEIVKVISRTVRYDAQTFAPIVSLVIDVPLEPVNEALTENNDELMARIGRAFIEAIKESARTSP